MLTVSTAVTHMQLLLCLPSQNNHHTRMHNFLCLCVVKKKIIMIPDHIVIRWKTLLILIPLLLAESAFSMPISVFAQLHCVPLFSFVYHVLLSYYLNEGLHCYAVMLLYSWHIDCCPAIPLPRQTGKGTAMALRFCH